MDDLGDLVACCCIDQRTDLVGAIGSRPDAATWPSGLRAASEFAGDVERGRRSDWPRCRLRHRCASLPPSPRRRLRRDRRRREQRKVRCRRAPSTQLRPGRRPFPAVSTHLGRAGERQLAHSRVWSTARQPHRMTPWRRRRSRRLAGALPPPARRTTARGGEWGVRGRLDDRGAAGGQGRADLAGRHRRREVPGGDRSQADPDRLHDCHDPLVPCRGETHLAPIRGRLLGEPAEELGGVANLAKRIRERLAVL